MSSSKNSSQHHKLIRIDRISDLPDHLLCHILSFLPTCKAAATSILSKRWQHLWTWVPILDFESDGLFDNKSTCFGDIVTKILLLRKTRCIRVFHMMCCGHKLHKNLLQSWICSAVSSNVEELYLRVINLEEDLQLPPCLVSCKTLTTLNLMGRFALNVPSSVHLPRLKVLNLGIVLYEGGHNSFRNLISACPVLDELVIYRYGDRHIFYEISSSTLTTLKLSDCLTKINTPALKYLRLQNSLLVEPPVNQLSNLVQANVDGLGSYEMPIQWLDVKKIIYAIYNVKSLHLWFGIMKCWSDHIAFFEICKFQNLIKLEVEVKCFQYSLVLVEKLLMNSPHLQHFTIVKIRVQQPCLEEPKCWMPLDAVPHCLSFHLTTFEFRWFEGFNAELDFLRYILKHSKAMLDMTIFSSFCSNSEEIPGIVHKLSMFEKGSARCRRIVHFGIMSKELDAVEECDNL